jgi:hypothetical protein
MKANAVLEPPYTILLKDIHFKSAKKLKEKLDAKIEGLAAKSSRPETRTIKSISPTSIPSETELKSLFAKLDGRKIKPMVLSLLEPYSEQFILKSRTIVTISDLYDPSYLSLTYPELLNKCAEINITLSDTSVSSISAQFFGLFSAFY